MGTSWKKPVTCQGARRAAASAAAPSARVARGAVGARGPPTAGLSTHHEAGVEEEDGHVKLLRGVGDGLHVRTVGARQVDAHRPELDRREALAQLGVGRLQQRVVERHQHDVEALRSERLGEGLADAAGRASHQRPPGVVPLAQVHRPAHIGQEQRHQVGAERHGGPKEQEGAEVGQERLDEVGRRRRQRRRRRHHARLLAEEARGGGGDDEAQHSAMPAWNRRGTRRARVLPRTISRNLLLSSCGPPRTERPTRARLRRARRDAAPTGATGDVRESCSRSQSRARKSREDQKRVVNHSPSGSSLPRRSA